MAGAVFVLVAAGLMLFPMRGMYAEERAFRAAVACPADSRSGECLRTVDARFDRTDGVQMLPKGGSTYWLYVTEPDGTSARARITGSPATVEAIGKGAPVRVTYWRGEIRYVDIGSWHADAHADVRGDYKLFLALGLGIGLFGLIPLWGWCAWRLKLETPLRLDWQALPVFGALGLVAIGVIAAVVTDGPAAAFGVVGLAVPVVAVVCAAVAVVWRRRPPRDDTVAVTPSVPAEERCFPGLIRGDVPYARTYSGGFLAAGPGSLAATPDPTGAFARHEAPRSLTPVRVRRPNATDPGFPYDSGRRMLVLECEDGEKPVLVVAERKNMPWVLGALR